MDPASNIALGVVLYMAMAIIYMIKFVARDIAEYWGEGIRDYTDMMRKDAIACAIVPSLFWPISYVCRMYVYMIRAFSEPLAQRAIRKASGYRPRRYVSDTDDD